MVEKWFTLRHAQAPHAGWSHHTSAKSIMYQLKQSHAARLARAVTRRLEPKHPGHAPTRAGLASDGIIC